MKRRFATIPVLAALALMLAGAAVAQPSQTAPQVESARQVTANPVAVRAHTIPAVAVHPDDPQVLAIAEGEGYTSSCGVQVSTNGGLTWREASSPQPAEWPRCMWSNQGSLAPIVFGPDGTLFTAFAGLETDSWQSTIVVARSSDLGQSWDSTEIPGLEADFDALLSGSHGMPVIAVDPNDAQRVYVAWQTNYNLWLVTDALPEDAEFPGKPLLATSSDGGATFSEPIDIVGDLDADTVDVHLLVDQDGALFAFYGEGNFVDEGPAPDTSLHVAVSRDHGATFTQDTLYTRGGTVNEYDGPMAWFGSVIPGINRSTGDVYLVFEQMGPMTPGVAFMRSTDGGASWSEPRLVNSQEPILRWEYPRMLPSLSVAPSGRIDVAWYDSRNDTTVADDESDGYQLQDVYYTYSLDGGQTWAADLRVTDRIIDRRIGIAGGGTDITGPVALASTNGAAILAWDDSRNGTDTTQAQDIYTTRVDFTAGSANPIAATADNATKLLWSFLGAAVALALGGLVLLLGLRRTDAAGTRTSAPEAQRETA